MVTVQFSVCLFIILITLCTCTLGLKCALTNLQGPQKNKGCIFPFKYQEIEFNACTNYSGNPNFFYFPDFEDHINVKLNL